LAQNKSALYTKPVDKVLELLSQDNQFIKFLQKTCEDNDLKYDDVHKHLGGLYHTASKSFNAHNQEAIIDSRSWSSNEILLLGAIFHYYKIPFSYYNNEHKLVNYPYKFKESHD